MENAESVKLETMELAVMSRWRIFSILNMLFIVGLFYRVSMAVISKDVSAELHLSAAQLGVASAVFFYCFAFAQIPLGPVIDRYGGRFVITCFGVITTCGSLLFALAPGYQAAVAGRALMGLGTACVLMGSLKIFTNWFSLEEFPRISALMLALGNVGCIAGTAPLAYAVDLFTWRPTFVAMTLAQAVATFSVFALVRDKPDQGSADASGSLAPQGSAGGVFATWKLLVKSPDFWLVSFIAFFCYATYMVLLALWGGPYLRETVGLTASETGFTLLCTSAGYILGGLLVGKVIELLGGSLEKTILLGQSALLVTMTAMLGPADHLSRPVLDTIFFLIGVSAASVAMIYPLARRLVPAESAATAMTCVNFFLLMGAASMQHVMGQYICSFQKGATGYPPAAYHGAFLIPISGLAVTLVLFSLRRAAKGFDGVVKG